MEINETSFQFSLFSHDSSIYAEELNLRDEVLRRPLGMSIYDDDLTPDSQSMHLGAFSGNRLVGVLQLLPTEHRSILKMRQFAVSPAFQGRQVGKSLLLFAEQQAALHHCTQIVLHARKVAVGFYLKQGYRVCSDEFTEVGIPHFDMQKMLPALSQLSDNNQK